MRLLDHDAWSQDHHGLLTRSVSGLSVAAWNRAGRNGLFERLHPGVARLPGTPRSAEQRIAAAVLAAGDDALASHRSAARLWGVSRPEDDPVDLIVPRRDRRPQPAGAVVHRPTDVLRLNPQRRANIRCTNLLRTLCDLGAVDPSGVGPAVGHALGAELVDLAALETACREHARQGRAGVVALRAAIDHWSLDAKPADSVLEIAFAQLVERYRLPPLEFHPVIAGWEVDFRVRGTAILLECDGWTTHGLDRRQFERDRRRRNDLSERGWIVIHFTYRAVTRRPGETARRIRRAVEQWRHRAPPDAVLGRDRYRFRLTTARELGDRTTGISGADGTDSDSQPPENSGRPWRR